jgi:hypothetical protein
LVQPHAPLPPHDAHAHALSGWVEQVQGEQPQGAQAQDVVGLVLADMGGLGS